MWHTKKLVNLRVCELFCVLEHTKKDTRLHEYEESEALEHRKIGIKLCSKGTFFVFHRVFRCFKFIHGGETYEDKTNKTEAEIYVARV